MKLTTHQAKTQFSKVIKAAQAGEEVIITSGRERKPVAEVIAVRPRGRKRKLGWLQGQLGGAGEEVLQPMSEDEIADWEG
jgi:prevent-host-death family protein